MIVVALNKYVQFAIATRSTQSVEKHATRSTVLARGRTHLPSFGN
eukprot:SAG31_NODE_41430_length_276_cov_0.587571_2_plen_44_part_01